MTVKTDKVMAAEIEMTMVRTITVDGYRYAKPGRSLEFTAAVKPAKADQQVVWQSSDTSVATVDQNGLVKTLSPGTARITASAADGSGVTGIRKLTVYHKGRTEADWIAHRGLNTLAKENTARAFRLAGEYGFWGCECDVWETKHDADGEYDVVISHDNSFQRVFDVDRKVRSMTAGEIRSDSRLSKVCFFQEYLDICQNYGMVPVIELKDKKMSNACLRRVIDMVYQMDGGVTLDNCRLISFHAKVLARALRYCRGTYGVEPTSAYLISYSNRGKGLKAFKRARHKGFTGVSVNKDILKKKYYTYCKRHDLLLSTWVYRETKKDENVLGRHLEQYQPATLTVDGPMFED